MHSPARKLEVRSGRLRLNVKKKNGHFISIEEGTNMEL